MPVAAFVIVCLYYLFSNDLFINFKRKLTKVRVYRNMMTVCLYFEVILPWCSLPEKYKDSLWDR